MDDQSGDSLFVLIHVLESSEIDHQWFHVPP